MLYIAKGTLAKETAVKIVMLGAPGAGKGTQAKRIAEYYQIPHISTGDIFRANIKAGTPLGLEAKRYMDAGGLVPDEVTIEALTEALAAEGTKIDEAVDIEVPDEAIIDRMEGRRSCPNCGESYHIRYRAPKTENICDVCGHELVQRADDKPETVAARLQVYHEQTQPLIDYYREQGVLREVDGTQEMEEVFEAIKALI